MSVTVQINTAEFNRALQQYYAVSKLEWSDIVNRKALQLAFEALRETEKADVAQIRNLENMEWWPRYVASRVGKGATRAQLRAASRKIIAGRVRAAGFLKSGWLPAIRALWPRVRNKPFNRSSTGGARQFGQAKGHAVVAMPSANPFAEIVNSAKGIEKIGIPAMNRAITKVTADMMQYIMRKNLEAWRKVFRF